MSNNKKTIERPEKVFNGKDVFFYALNLVYGSLMVFYSQIPNILVSLISLIVFVCNYLRFSRNYSKPTALFFNAILFLPVSFISVFGTDYSQIPVTWFSVSLIVLMAIAVFTNRIKKTYLFFYLLFTITFMISFLLNQSSWSSLSQFFTISLCLFSFQISGLLCDKNDEKKKIIKKSIGLYILSAVSLSFQILIQYFYVSWSGETIGHYSAMGGDRVAYAGLMGDYSFASLYLATAGLMLLILYVQYKKLSFVKFIISFAFFVFMSVLTSARTGFFSLMITAIPYVLANLNGKKIGRMVPIVTLAIITIPFVLSFFTSLRNMNGFFDSSGRIEVANSAFSIIESKPIFGIGPGSGDLANNYGIILPHNYFVQYLLQFGIIGLSVISVSFIMFFINNRRNNCFMWLFVMCAIGSMFIPDILSSRFLSILIIIIMTERERNRGGLENEKAIN